jgi:hypothetical protein
LTLTADNRSQKVQERHQICNGRFSPGEAMLIWIKFNEMQDMIMNNEFKQLRKIVENRNNNSGRGIELRQRPCVVASSGSDRAW